MRTILCTVDFSPSTRHSLSWGVSMARQMRAHLSVLHAYRLIQPGSGEIVELKKAIEQEARQKFEMLEKEYLVGQGISYDFKIEVGFISDRIEDRAKKNSLDFVVMDKNMKANSNESFEELMEHIHVPMLVIP
ncbi:MAG: universal stress protein [Cyclobacteriaceae bacterium]